MHWSVVAAETRLGGLQGQIYFHHNNMKTFICFSPCCVDICMIGAKVIVGATAQEHRSRCRSYWNSWHWSLQHCASFADECTKNNAPKKVLNKAVKRLTVLSFNPWVHVFSIAYVTNQALWLHTQGECLTPRKRTHAVVSVAKLTGCSFREISFFA